MSSEQSSAGDITGAVWDRWMSATPHEQAIAFASLQEASVGPGPLHVRRVQDDGEVEVVDLVVRPLG